MEFVAVVDCIIEHNNKFLVIRRDGKLIFPGGKVEVIDGLEGKNILQEAVRREVYEEVGIKLSDPISYLTSSYFYDNKHQKNVMVMVFHCKLSMEDPEVKASTREVPEYFWMSDNELREHKDCSAWIAGYLDHLPATK